MSSFPLGKTLDREVFIKPPPEDQRVKGWLWKLQKPLCGLDDTSRKFWLKVKDTLVALGLRILPRDQAFYYLYEQGELQGAVLTHVDNFTVAGNENILEEVTKGISDTLTISKVEKDKFRFTGWDIEKYEDEIKV